MARYFSSFLIIFFLCFVCPVGVSASVDTLNDGLVGWWKMDECQGNTIKDSSGNGNNGELVIGPLGTQTTAGTCASAGTAWGNSISGKLGPSLSFDGTDDYLKLDSITPMISGKGVGTIALWFKVPATITRTPLSLPLMYFGDYAYLAVGSITGAWPDESLTFFNPPYVAAAYRKGENYFADGIWHHVVWIVSKNHNEMYIDGTKVALDYGCYWGFGCWSNATANTGNCMWQPISSQKVGLVKNMVTNFGSGAVNLDDVRVYERDLSEDEIVALYSYRTDTLSINLPPTSTTTLTNYIPIEFTAKLSLPKKSEGASFDNQVNIKFADGHLIPLVYEKQDEQDGLFLWKGSYRKTNALSNKNFYFQGTLEFADCSKIEGNALAFKVTDQSVGTYTFRNDRKDGILVTTRNFSPETATPSIQIKSEGPFAYLQQFFSNLFNKILHRQSEIVTFTTKTDSFERKQTDEVLSGVEARKMCKINLVAPKPFGAHCTVATECSDGVGGNNGWCKDGICADPWISGACSIRVFWKDLDANLAWRTTRSLSYAPQVIAGVLIANSAVDLSGLTIDINGKPNNYPAQRSCMEIGGRLPTQQEAYCIYNDRASYGSFSLGQYWTSNDYLDHALVMNFSNGSTANYQPKEWNLPVRCVR